MDKNSIFVQEAVRRGLVDPRSFSKDQTGSSSVSESKPKNSSETVLKKGARALSNILKTANRTVDTAGASMVKSGDVGTGLIRAVGDVIGAGATVPLDIAAGIAPETAANVRDIAGRVLSKPAQVIDAGLNMIPNERTREYVSSIGSVAPDLLGAGAAKGAVSSLKRGASAVGEGASNITSKFKKRADIADDVPPPPTDGVAPTQSVVGGSSPDIKPKPKTVLVDIFGPAEDIQKSAGELIAKGGSVKEASANLYSDGLGTTFKHASPDMTAAGLKPTIDTLPGAIYIARKNIYNKMDSYLRDSKLYLSRAEDLDNVVRNVENTIRKDPASWFGEGTTAFARAKEDIATVSRALKENGVGVSLKDVESITKYLNEQMKALADAGKSSGKAYRALEMLKKGLDNEIIKRLDTLAPQTGNQFALLRKEYSDVKKIEDTINKKFAQNLKEPTTLDDIFAATGDSTAVWAIMQLNPQYLAAIFGGKFLARVGKRAFDKMRLNTALDSIYKEAMGAEKLAGGASVAARMAAEVPAVKGKLRGQLRQRKVPTEDEARAMSIKEKARIARENQKSKSALDKVKLEIAKQKLLDMKSKKKNRGVLKDKLKKKGVLKDKLKNKKK
jgi:hypothetical protein